MVRQMLNENMRVTTNLTAERLQCVEKESHRISFGVGCHVLNKFTDDSMEGRWIKHRPLGVNLWKRGRFVPCFYSDRHGYLHGLCGLHRSLHGSRSKLP